MTTAINLYGETDGFTIHLDRYGDPCDEAEAERTICGHATYVGISADQVPARLVEALRGVEDEVSSAIGWRPEARALSVVAMDAASITVTGTALHVDEWRELCGQAGLQIGERELRVTQIPARIRGERGMHGTTLPVGWDLSPEVRRELAAKYADLVDR